MRIYAYTYKRMNDLHKGFSSWVHWIYECIYIYVCMHSMWLIFVDVRDQNHIEYLLFYYILHVWWISTGGLTKILWTTSTISYLAWIILAFQQGEDINHRPPSPQWTHPWLRFSLLECEIRIAEHRRQSTKEDVGVEEWAEPPGRRGYDAKSNGRGAVPYG